MREMAYLDGLATLRSPGRHPRSTGADDARVGRRIASTTGSCRRGDAANARGAGEDVRGPVRHRACAFASVERFPTGWGAMQKDLAFHDSTEREC
jgi:hypothetical protein